MTPVDVCFSLRAARQQLQSCFIDQTDVPSEASQQKAVFFSPLDCRRPELNPEEFAAFVPQPAAAPLRKSKRAITISSGDDWLELKCRGAFYSSSFLIPPSKSFRAVLRNFVRKLERRDTKEELRYATLFFFLASALPFLWSESLEK